MSHNVSDRDPLINERGSDERADISPIPHSFFSSSSSTTTSVGSRAGDAFGDADEGDSSSPATVPTSSSSSSSSPSSSFPSSSSSSSSSSILSDELSSSPSVLYLTVFCTSCSSWMRGFDTGAFSIVLLQLQHKWFLSSLQTEVLACALVFGCIFSSLLGGPFCNRFGRALPLPVSGLLCLAGAIFACTAPTVGTVIFARVVFGLGIGLSTTSNRTYIAEISPAVIRGVLLAAYASLESLAFCCALFVSLIPGISWRLLMLLAGLPAVFGIIGYCWVPESPRWLVQQGRLMEADRSLRRLRGPHANIDTEMQGIKNSVALIHADEAKQATSGGVRPHPLLRFFRLSWRYRLEITAGFGLMILGQLGNIKGIYYPTIIHQAGFESMTDVTWGTIIIGLMLLCSHACAVCVVDRIDRRVLLMAAYSGVAVSLICISLSFYYSIAPLVVVGLSVYALFHAGGVGSGDSIVSTEVYPLEIRMVAQGIGTALSYSVTILTTLTFLSLTEVIGFSGVFLVIASMCVLAVLFVYLLVPETRGRTMEQIEAAYRNKHSHDGL